MTSGRPGPGERDRCTFISEGATTVKSVCLPNYGLEAKDVTGVTHG